MPQKKDYRAVLERVRKKKEKNQYHSIVLVVVVLIVGVFAFGGVKLARSVVKKGHMEQEAVNASVPDQQTDTQIEKIPEVVLETLSAEELAEIEEQRQKQDVVDSYENLGMVKTSGYLNVRKTPESFGEVIGKLDQNSACEILDSQGDWYHIRSGGIEGYVSSQYVVTGQEARNLALEQVQRMAVVNTDRLNIRSEAVLDPTNVVGQALFDERYLVLNENNDWIQIEEGYVAAEFVEVKYAVNEARKLDLRAMALNQYEHLVISKVDNYLNIRKEPNTSDESNIIGKLPSRAAGEILETLDGWYKIKSGAITGYITAESQYVAIGQEARDLAEGAASLMAIVKTDMLNVRAQPNTDAKIWTQISKEERYNVVEQLDGWVQIELDAGDGESWEDSDQAFISTRDHNVEVRYALTEAIKFSPVEIRASEQASLRSQLVNYGLKFVGNRYVWGGTNPNTGADCSGFVQYIYRNVAGIGLPRVSRDQARTGIAISSSEMQPGDLIFYANSGGTVNHVAMYIGNGQIVHAASKRSGIKISTWNYRNPKTIRRILR